MIIDKQAETEDGARIRLSLVTLSTDTHSRIQELPVDMRIALEDALQEWAKIAVKWISENTVKKTA